MPQETGFPRGFTAFAFVDYMAILKEWTDLPSRHEEVRRVIDLVGLTDVATKRVSALSGGQRRRVVLAQALLGRPDLLVLDEPTAGLDPAQRGRLRDVLGRAGETSTVVISTHQTEDVAALCERVVVLDGGRVLFDGTVTDMVEPSRRAGSGWQRSDTLPPSTPGAPAAAGSATSATRLRRPSSSSRPWRTPTCCWSGTRLRDTETGGSVMSTAISPRPEAPTAEGWPALRALARVEAKRFARHPLFLLGIAIMLIPIVAVFWQQELDANPMTGTLFIAFLIGVFGFIVAHRLTTSLLRTRDLATTTPVGRQQRTLALCLACLVPATAGVVVAVFMLVTAAIWTPVGDPVTAHVAWFRDDPAVDVLATLIAMGPVAALGGPLLGVAVARWAPFRGSALIGVVTLVFLTAMPSEASVPWRVLSPWPLLVDEYVNDGGGPIVRSSFVPGVEPIWVLPLPAVPVRSGRRGGAAARPGAPAGLLGAGAALTLGAVGCFLLAVS